MRLEKEKTLQRSSLEKLGVGGKKPKGKADSNEKAG